MKRLLLLFLLLFSGQALAQHSFVEPEQVYPVGQRHVFSPADAVTKRAEILAIIEGDTPLGEIGTFIDGWAGTSNQGDPVGYFGQTPATTRWFAYFWPGGVVSRIHADTFGDSDCLVIYHSGHYPDRFFVTAPPAGSKAFNRAVLGEVGCHFLLVSPPLQGENLDFMPGLGYPPANLTDGHFFLFADPARMPSEGTPLRYWLDATYAAIAYMEAQHGPYSQIIAPGLSGGGFTVTLLAALNPRITHTYAVSGSTPFGNISDSNDLEQTLGIAQLGIDYPDLYVLGTVDAEGNVNRKNRILYSSNDNVLSRAEHTHIWSLLDFARTHGFGEDMLNVLIDYKALHDFSGAMTDYIIADILAE